MAAPFLFGVFWFPHVPFSLFFQVSSKSGEKWPNKSTSMILETVAVAILENGGTLPVLRFLYSACST
jgi:hypothetical protein